VKLTTQILALTATSLRSIPRRLGNSLVIVIGMAGVVAVLISVFAMSVSFRKTIKGDGRADRVIVLANAATEESESNLTRETVAAIENTDGVRHDTANRPLVSAELILVAPVARKRDSSDVNVTFRGVGEQYFAVRPELRLVAGRMFRPGTQELMVGASANAQFAGLELGSQVRLRNGDWTVVGMFAGGNGSRESEVIADARTVMSAYQRDTFNTLTLVLDPASSFEKLKSRLDADPALAVDVYTEPEYLERASDSVNRLLRLVAYGIGSIMALGALFGALNSMHSSVAARRAEIATLRAIGFASFAVSAAVLIEALLLALFGALIGVAIAYAAFNGAMISTLGGAVWDSQLVYSLSITPSLAVTATLVACALGLLGGMQPALRAALDGVADALHET
jgi:putative ABC transport system permease protein